MTRTFPAPLVHRRRGATLERAIFDAVLAQLRAGGYESVTMDGVAAAAGTGKAALYRRWPSKADLVVDVLERCVGPLSDLPDTGTVRDDLLAVLRGIARLLNSPVGCVISTITAKCDRPRTSVELVGERLVLAQQRMLVEVLRRGVERGEVRADTPLGLIAEVGPSMLLRHFLVDGPPVPDRLVVSIVDELLIPVLRPASASSTMR